jgi:hypothetical protein
MKDRTFFVFGCHKGTYSIGYSVLSYSGSVDHSFQGPVRNMYSKVTAAYSFVYICKYIKCQGKPAYSVIPWCHVNVSVLAPFDYAAVTLATTALKNTTQRSIDNYKYHCTRSNTSSSADPVLYFSLTPSPWELRTTHRMSLVLYCTAPYLNVITASLPFII